MLRAGYRYNFIGDGHLPAVGFGLDDGKVSLDYGVQFELSEDSSMSQWHSIGVRFRL